MTRDLFEHGIPQDWCIDFGAKAALSGGSNRAAIRNTGSYCLAVDFLHVACPKAGTFTLRGHNILSTVGTSAGYVTPRHAAVGVGSAAFPARGYYGTTAATSGITASAAYVLQTRRLEAAGTLDFADTGPWIVAPNKALVLRCAPSSQQTITVACRVRVLPWQTIRTIA